MKINNLNTLKEHKGAVYALCQGPEPHLIYSAGADRHVLLWDLKKQEAVKAVAKSPTTVISLLYLPQFNYLLIGQVEGGVHIIDLEESKEVKYLKHHKGYIFDLQYLEQKQELIMASGDGTFSVCSIPDGKLLLQERVGEGKLRSIDLAASRKEIAISAAEGKVQLRRQDDFQLLQEYTDYKSAVNIVRYQPDEAALWVGEKDALLSKIDLQAEAKTPTIAAHYWAIYDVVFEPNGKWMATASRDKTIKIWDFKQEKVLKRLEGLKDQAHTHSVNKLHYCNKLEMLVSTGDDGSLKLWQIQL